MNSPQSLHSNKNLQQSFARGTTVIMLAMVLVKIFGAVFKIPLMAILGGEGYGYFFSAYNLYNPIYALSTVGFPLATSKLISEKIAQNRFRDVEKIYKISTKIFLFTGISGTLLMMLCAYPYVKFTHSPNVIYSIFALAPTVFFVCLMSIYKGYYQGMRFMVPTAVSEVIEAIGKVIFGLGFSNLAIRYVERKINNKENIFGISYKNFGNKETTIAAFGAAGAVLGITFAALCGFLYIYFKHLYIKKNFLREKTDFCTNTESNKSIFRKMLKLAIPIGLSAIITNLSGVIDSLIINNRLDFIMRTAPQVLIEKFHGMIPQINIQNSTVHIFLWGCFGTMTTITMLIPTFLQSISINALPMVTQTLVKRNKLKTKNIIEQIFKLTTIIAVPCGLGLSGMAQPIFNLIYGNTPESFVAGKIMIIAGISIIFVSVSTPLCSILQAAGKAEIPLKILTFGLTLKAILNYILVSRPEININGANISTLISYIIICSLLLYEINKIVGVFPNLVKGFILPLFCGAACSVSATLTYNIISLRINPKISTIISICAGAMVYVVTLFLTDCVNLKEFKKILVSRKIQ